MQIQQVCIWWAQLFQKMPPPIQLCGFRENQDQILLLALNVNLVYHITPEYFCKTFRI